METRICGDQTTREEELKRLRGLSEDEWIGLFSSGTLQKCRDLGMAYRDLYIAERVAWEWGFGFECLPRSRVTFGDAIAEGDCPAITETVWHAKRIKTRSMFVSDDYEVKYLHVDDRDGTKREGIGIILRQTDAPWVPKGCLVFAIIAVFNPHTKSWLEALNPC